MWLVVFGKMLKCCGILTFMAAVELHVCPAAVCGSTLIVVKDVIVTKSALNTCNCVKLFPITVSSVRNDSDKSCEPQGLFSVCSLE